MALGTDTGGSGRIPFACCATVGFKPSLGKLSLAGTFPLAPSFDTVSPMARTVADCTLMYSVLSGDPVPEPRIAGRRSGVLAPCPEADQLAALGAELEVVELPTSEVDLMPRFAAECVLTHRGLYAERAAEYSPDLQVKLEAAQGVRAVDFLAARVALQRWRRRLRTVPGVDLIVSPTLGIEVPAADSWEPDVWAGICQYTRPFNFLGWPAIAVDNLQLAGRDDQTVLAAALAWEQAFGPAGRRHRLRAAAVSVREGPGEASPSSDSSWESPALRTRSAASAGFPFADLPRQLSAGLTLFKFRGH